MTGIVLMTGATSALAVSLELLLVLFFAGAALGPGWAATCLFGTFGPLLCVPLLRRLSPGSGPGRRPR